MAELSLLAFSYLLGSIPCGFIVAYLVKGIDIRNFGSGNIGATNVSRVVSKKWGIAVFALDFLKGVVPMLTAQAIGGFEPYVFIMAAVAVVAGHNWTMFLKFKGGKGVATSVGAIVGLSCVFLNVLWALLAAVGVWCAFFYGLRYVSIASLAAGLAFFVTSLCLDLPIELKVFAFILFAFIVIRHKQNIHNLIARKENRF